MQLACPMHVIEAEEGVAPLGRITWRIAPAVVSNRPLANFLERIERRNHRCSRHGDDNQEGTDEHPPFHVQTKAGRRHTDGRNDQDECHDSTDDQGPEDGRLHDLSYIIVGIIHENGNLQRRPADV